MESDLQQHHYFLHDQPQLHHQNQMNSGLMRYQSAPSTYFSSFLDKEVSEDLLNRPTSPETERILSRFLANSGDTSGNISNQNLGAIKEESPVKEVEPPQQVNQQAQIMALINDKNDTTKLHQQQQQGNYSYASQRFYQSQSKPPLPGHGSGSGSGYRAATQTGVEQLPQMNVGGASNSNLVRHSSSPAGLFANISNEFENGYAVMTGLGEYGVTNREASYPVASRPPSSSEQISVIAEIGNQNMGENNPDSSNYVPSFPISSWDDSALMPAGAKGLSEGDRSLSGGLNALETQDGKARRPPLMLAHHLSLPKTSAEMSAIEKLLQDSVPCKIRAKRGCATHPRSIAERVRRTRISERMRKLQDLVPNMDKQTNTADMLDLAVEYIKDLQRQVKRLSETRARCTCTGGAAQKAEV